MKIETKYSAGDKVKVSHGESAVETKVVGVTASEVIEGEREIKRSEVFYCLEFNREQKYSEAELSPVEKAPAKEFDKPAEKLKA